MFGDSTLDILIMMSQKTILLTSVPEQQILILLLPWFIMTERDTRADDWKPWAEDGVAADRTASSDTRW